MEDLSRMFRLFSKIPRGLDPVSSIFKQVNYFLSCPLINLLLKCFFLIMLTGISSITYLVLLLSPGCSFIIPFHLFFLYILFPFFHHSKKCGLIFYFSMLLLKAQLWSNRLRMLQATKRFVFYLPL